MNRLPLVVLGGTLSFSASKWELSKLKRNEMLLLLPLSDHRYHIDYSVTQDAVWTCASNVFIQIKKYVHVLMLSSRFEDIDSYVIELK